MADKQTPLMRQYSQIKNKYPDTILLFRLGDFFETFLDDAVVTAKVCGITLTKRNNGTADDIPLAGFPHHQLDNYLPKLVRAGYRVAVCEQLEDPKNARGIVRRDVVEVVTPGVAFNEKLLDTKRNNYLAAVALGGFKGSSQSTSQAVSGIVGVACADISTGEFFTAEVYERDLADILGTLQPAEILVAKKDYVRLSEIVWGGAANGASGTSEVNVLNAGNASMPTITRLEDWIFEEKFARELLLRHFRTPNLKGFGVEDYHAGVVAAGAALHYVSEAQRGHLPHIKRLAAFNPSEFMVLDFATKRNLEVIFAMHDSLGAVSKQGTLLHILDKTETPMGGRLFTKWLSRPLRRLQQLLDRQSAVAALASNDALRAALRQEFSEVGDIERLMSKISTGRATPRDVVALRSTLARLPRVMALVSDMAREASCDALQSLVENLVAMDDVVMLIANAVVDDPPAQTGAGTVFREGFSKDLDDIRNTMYSGKTWIADFQEREREASGIGSLKVGFTGVFGYYIEITNAHKSKTPSHYERKQTLANAERYTTSELKEMEQKILSAEERLGEVERELFQQLRVNLTEAAERAQQNAQTLAALDCLQSFAHAAREYNFCRPVLEESERLEIIEGRHPVVERLLPVGERYVPNTTLMDTGTEQLHIITGPNMSGKSSYLRQVGLITLLAHIGAFVPAKQAVVGLVDRIFTRVGAQDNITAGESTFLVEMQEAANILNNATRKSLILLDEVGRGTATFDGISIAWAIAEHLHDHTQAKTLFATHYHEMTDIANRFARIRNYKADVQEIDGKILFTRRITTGTADHSFGIHVAEMAGLPASVTHRAKEILRALEGNHQLAPAEPTTFIGSTDAHVAERAAAPLALALAPASEASSGNFNDPSDPSDLPQYSLFEIRDDKLRDKVRALNVNAMTPMQALQALAELQAMVH